MPLSISKGLTREDVLQALADLDAGVVHSFGPPTGFELVHEGKRYAPKAVIGLACRSLLGRVLMPQEFSGGEAPGQANYVLREPGFTVLAIAHSLEGVEEAASRSRDWSEQEVELLVAIYFAMLEAELSGRPYSKAEHNASLRPLLDNRSKASVEFKHQKVSAALVDMGLPYIEGYRPARNYQKTLLPRAIQAYLDRRPTFFDGLDNGPILSPKALSPVHESVSIDSVFVERPEIKWAVNAAEKPWLSRRGRRADFANRDARDRDLGMLGDYRILREIGRGGMGVVYEAEQVSLGRQVALKVLPSQVAEDRQALERFRREAKSAARLHHSNIVPVSEVGRAGEVAYYAMQFIEGQGLDKVIDEPARARDTGRKPGVVQGPGPTVAAAAPGAGEPALGRIAESLLKGRFATEGAVPSTGVRPAAVTGPAETEPLARDAAP
jgi:hypothetical protein